MKILAIETSCDDTGVAVLEIKGDKNPSFSVLSNIVASQTEVHKKYGGVFPAMAKREHQKNLVPVFETALKEAGMLRIFNYQFPIFNEFLNSKFLKIKEILEREPELTKQLILFLEKYEKPAVDLISVTNGPGLEPCLWVGVNFAKAISYFWGIPVVPVNHIESHILVNFFDNNTVACASDRLHKRQVFPAMCLVASGGHTQLILMKGIGKYKILGETRDDAAGECFDKCAKILGLGYPGGPEIAKLASKKTDRHRKSNKIVGLPMSPKLPRPMINTKDYDFSFSGLKTAVLYKWRETERVFDGHQKRVQLKAEFAREIQQAVIDVLLKKTMKAVKDFNAKTVILGGGVSANSELRSEFKLKVESEKLKVKLIFSPANLSTDNGLMVAIAGYFHRNKKVGWEKIQVDSNLRIGK